MQEITYFTTDCRYMWILQDKDGNEHEYVTGIGRVPRHLIEAALSPEGRAKGLEIWAETYGLMGRGKELGFVPLDNDASFVKVHFQADPDWGRKERSLYWITSEWYQEIHRPDTVVVNPWQQERDRRIAHRHEFLDEYLVRTRTETFKGRLHECEEWMIARRFPMMDDQRWEIAMNGGVAEWPGDGRPAELTIERT